MNLERAPPAGADAWLPAQLPWVLGRAKGPAALAASEEIARGAVMHTCNASASSGAPGAGRLLGFGGRAIRMLGFVGLPHQRGRGSVPCTCRSAAPHSQRALVPPGRGA